MLKTQRDVLLRIIKVFIHAAAASGLQWEATCAKT
jgi:hypothetical protein